MDKIRVIFSIAGLHPESGGPSQTVPALAGALAAAGAAPEVVALHYGAGSRPPHLPPVAVPVTFVPCASPWARRLQWTPNFASILEKRCRETAASILHDTGLWLLTNHAAARVSARLNLPRMVSPRGMLSGWALQHKNWKKGVAWSCYQRRDLATARVLHATSTAEVADIRAAGLTQPVAMIPNGVDLPPPPPENLAPADRRTLLFLGRIHPVKGLLDLVRAWARVRPAGWRVVVAGGDEMNHRAEVEAAVRAARLESDFRFIGPTENNAKWNCFRQADLFVLPSHSENFGLVVAEALACGVPVIATRGTPWEDLVAHRCGWWVPVGEEGLAEALREATALPPAQLVAMGRQGRALVENRYAWPKMAEHMLAVYAWMLGRGAMPGCVNTIAAATKPPQ
jgi:glycosyltransferase involved in cell wall biosynthesis